MMETEPTVNIIAHTKEYYRKMYTVTVCEYDPNASEVNLRGLTHLYSLDTLKKHLEEKQYVQHGFKVTSDIDLERKLLSEHIAFRNLHDGTKLSLIRVSNDGIRIEGLGSSSYYDAKELSAKEKKELSDIVDLR